MAGCTMNQRVAVVLAALLALAGCGRHGQSQPSPLAGAAIGGPFSLTDDHGRKFTDRDLLGRYVLIYFGYTYCPDACPTDLQVMSQGLRRFEKQDPARAAKILPVFVTVDPARDTPAVLRRYVAAFDPHMIGLTGPAAAIEAMKKSYGIYAQAEPATAPGVYLVGHSRTDYLFGPDGKPITMITPEDDPVSVAKLLATWVK
jgi:protein SCO1/2